MNPYGLTKRELQILQHTAAGLTAREISQKLFVSLRTIQTHLDRIRIKTGVTSKEEAAVAVGMRLQEPSILSSRETEVLQLVVQGLTARTIGEKLGISTRTVEKHVTNILNHLGARNKTLAGVIAIKRGLISAQKPL